MTRLLYLLPLILLATGACAPLIELEDENAALRSRVDSLEIVLAECRGQGGLLEDRLAAIEAENIELDDRNRELTATLAEARFQQQAQGNTGARVVDPDTTRPAEQQAPVVPLSDAAPPPPDRASGSVEAQYDGRRTAGLEFLRTYQSALSAYNEKRHDEAVRLFGRLLSTGQRNDMIDNCLYWMGEAEMQLGRTPEAIGHFTRTVACEGADKVDDALLSRAAAHRAAGGIDQARADLQRLLREHPHSELIGQARRMLRSLE